MEGNVRLALLIMKGKVNTRFGNNILTKKAKQDNIISVPVIVLL